MINHRMHRNRRTLRRAVYGGAALALAAMSACSEATGPSGGTVAATGSGIYVFSDRSDATLESLYVFREDGVLAQVAQFPGYADRNVYWVAVLPEDLRRRSKEWSASPSEISPPFTPDGRWFCRVLLPADVATARQDAYFKNSNAALRQWFVDLRKAVVLPDNRIARVPAWAEADSRLRQLMGFF